MSAAKLKQKYDVVIVLASGIIKDDSGPFVFSGNGKQFSYNITNDPFEFRFKAAAKLYKDGATKKFILVGGELKDASARRSEIMKYRLTSFYGIPESALITLVSKANTEGNAQAVAAWIADNKHSGSNIGLLTNFYHLPRSIKLFETYAKLKPSPLSAESLIFEEEFENIETFYRDQGLNFIIGNDAKNQSELGGLFALEADEYTSGIS